MSDKCSHHFCSIVWQKWRSLAAIWKMMSICLKVQASVYCWGIVSTLCMSLVEDRQECSNVRRVKLKPFIVAIQWNFSSSLRIAVGTILYISRCLFVDGLLIAFSCYPILIQCCYDTQLAGYRYFPSPNKSISSYKQNRPCFEEDSVHFGIEVCFWWLIFCSLLVVVFLVSAFFFPRFCVSMWRATPPSFLWRRVHPQF